MASEPASSWHPAFMPNSAADLAVQFAKAQAAHIHNETDHTAGAADTGPDSKVQNEDQNHELDNDEDDGGSAWLVSEDSECVEVAQPTQSALPTEEFARTSAQPPTIKQTKSTGKAADAWSSNDDVGGDEGSAWLVSDEPVAHVAPVEVPGYDLDPKSESSPLQPTIEELVQPKAFEGEAAKPEESIATVNISQHASSMSFARTVSQEVNFHDDDDEGEEWNLGRSDTDTFSFMPPTDRTNSFPAVPPLVSDSGRHDDVPLPSNQALDVMEEDEREAELEEEDYMMRSPESDDLSSQRHGTFQAQHGPSRSVGGEVEGTNSTAEEARFEEGLPLIPPLESTDKSTDKSTADKASIQTDPFGAEDGNDDDFFGQLQKNDHQNTLGNDAPQLQRKSTMQVMAAIDDGGHDILEDAHVGTTNGSDELALGSHSPKGTELAPAVEDLASKWEQAFGGDEDDDFLLEDDGNENQEIDPTAFLGSDDEGLLDDDMEEPAGVTHAVANSYIPANANSQQTASYTPVTPHVASTQTQSHSHQPPSAPYGGAFGQYGQQPAPTRPEASRAESFADKSKGGYASPYDLPTDLVTKTIKPRKRPSLQQLQPETAAPPPRSASMYSPGQAPPASTPPGRIDQISQRPALNQKVSAPALRSKGSFFEELPMSSKPRPASRHSQEASSPSHYSPVEPPQPGSTSPSSSRPTPLHSTGNQPFVEQAQASPAVTNLVAPPKINPYAALQGQTSVTPPLSNTSRYSPAPPGQHGGGVPAPPAGAASRYSPAPSAGSRPNSSYGAGPPHSAHPHLPRTSSPLAHFDSAGASEVQSQERRMSSSFEPRLNRVSSLPPTREVEEEEDEEVTSPGNRSFSANHVAGSQVPHSTARQTPPLPSSGKSQAAVTSPPKRINSNYVPQAAAVAAATQATFVPPPRAHTQSPSALHSDVRKTGKPVEVGPRPSSSHAQLAPPVTKPSQMSYAPSSRSRGLSVTNMVPPTDGRENDPLERWRGVPVMAWGVGGTFVTTFPKSIPRYAVGQTTPSTVRTVGEVRVQSIKDLDPLQDRLAKFPGPLKGKSKKKEAIAWLSAGIESMEKEIPDVSFHAHLSLEAKRSIERILLWKLLRIFIEHDGALEGTAAVDKAVREVLAPEAAELQNEGPSLLSGAEPTSTVTSMKADSVDSGIVEKIRIDLLRGDRETAVWTAVDKRLWGHALIISQTVSPDLYKKVAQEFVRKEVNYPGHNNESLAALYNVLSGNYDECVDELVPSHARAGLQLMSTESSSGPTKDAMDGLDKWRETLTLVLSNRSNDDVRGLNALGKLLSSYGRAEAAHICFIFSRSLSVFGGLDDPNANFVLIGADHYQQPVQSSKEAEALQLSEIYEYGLSLSGSAAASAGAPHLAAYKLQHAVTLAEYGFRDKALQYCEAIAAAIVAQTRRSPYHHHILEASVDDFMTRLKQAPKEVSSSWISKPTMGKVSDSMWSRFNKFVSGDEVDGNGDGENKPFDRITPSPNISRPPSTSAFDVYGSSPSYPATAQPAPAGAVASRYAPMVSSHPVANVNPYTPAAMQSPYAPATTTGPGVQEHAPNPYESAYPGATTVSQSQTGGYQPTSYPAAAGSEYQPAETIVPTQPSVALGIQPPTSGEYQHYGLQDSPDIKPQAAEGNTNQGYQPTSSYGYEPPQPVSAALEENEQQQQDGISGYEPPSFQPYGYEPPSYQPEEENDDAPKPKKKSFMDDDDDDIPALKQSQDKTKAEKDRENEEMFRKAAEEDAKRAAAAAPAKKGWGFGGWFGGSKKAEGNIGEASPGKPIKAKLGEQSSFVYDPELKRWINKKPGAENVEAKKATPPPPRAGHPSAAVTPPSGTPPPPMGRSSVPPMGGPPRPSPGTLSYAQSMENLSSGAVGTTPPVLPARSVSSNHAGSAPSSSGPPSRPTTSMSNASSIDDLLGAPAPRKAGQKKPRKGGRYVDVMAK